MQVRVPFLAALAALASVPALAQPTGSASAGADCFRRAPASDRDLSSWQAAPCMGQASSSALPDGLAGGPPARAPMAPPAYSPPTIAYQANAAASYAPPPPPSYPAPAYPGPAYSGSVYSGADFATPGYATPGYAPPAYDPPLAYAPTPSTSSAPAYQGPSSAGPVYASADLAAPGQAYDTSPAYSSPPPRAGYEPNRAPYYAGNIVSAPASMPAPAATTEQAYAAAPPVDLTPAYPQPVYPQPAYAQAVPAYGPPPLPDYGSGSGGCALSSGALPGGGYWQRQDCRGSGAAVSGYTAQTYPPAAPPTTDYRGGYASSGAYSQQQASGYQVSNGGYVYAAPSVAPGSLPGYAPGQCVGSDGLIAGGQAQYQAQTCERSSSQSYSYASNSGSAYAGGAGQIQGDRLHWGVAGRDIDGFLTWPGKVGQ